MTAETTLTFGAFPQDGGTLFRVWANVPEEILLVLGDGRRMPLSRTGDHWELRVDGAGAGTRYGYLLDGEGPFPDPYSGSQPEGVHALSEVVDPSDFAWSDADWNPPPVQELILYELHVGTFTPEGTFDAAIARLPYLRDLGVTAVELMPVAAFQGERGWGYDGVYWFALFQGYGGLAAMQRFIDRAHAEGLAVILDVVYNHFGPAGNYFAKYTSTLFTDAHQTPWGAALNLDQPGSHEVRELIVSNLQYWSAAFHVDGFRLDATFSLIDTSAKHILAEASERLRGARGIPPYLIAETHENEVRYYRASPDGGFSFDSAWADDFHHEVHRLLTGEHEGYYGSFAGTLDELARTINQGFLFEGQQDFNYGDNRGTRARDVDWYSFVYCLQNHDQVGNRATGERLNHLTSIESVRVATALHLLLPQLPLIFQGQEFFASAPFQYFTDHDPELGRLVTEGRTKEFASFQQFGGTVPDPQASETFLRSKLDWSESTLAPGATGLALVRTLLRIRRTDPVLVQSRKQRHGLQAWATGTALLVLTQNACGARLVAANFGSSLAEIPLPDARWQPLMSTSDPEVGGNGIPPRLHAGVLSMPPLTTCILRSE